MAKPRIFVSSTYYDLKHIRDRLESFIESFGYEPVLFESGDVPFHHDVPLDESCYAEVKLCHILILLIGGRYGMAASEDASTSHRDQQFDFYNSITRKEYLTARERDIPIFVFVEKNVLAEYETYRHNKTSNQINYAHVDSVNIFRLIDEIISRERNNFVRGFERFDDISHWLKEQWAGLFADLITKRSAETGLRDLTLRVSELGQITGALKQYSEVILKKVQPEGSQEIIGEQDRKLEAGRVQAFSKEDMIRYLLREGPLPEMPGNRMRAGVELSAQSLYGSFLRSNTIEEFMQLGGFSPEFIERFLQMHGEPARRDYAIIAQRYLGREPGAPVPAPAAPASAEATSIPAGTSAPPRTAGRKSRPSRRGRSSSEEPPTKV
jgi:Mg2+ and Co2+ transporter CorA